jgi:lipoprotein-anchoring transpeptidase ErfK/SrfK
MSNKKHHRIAVYGLLLSTPIAFNALPVLAHAPASSIQHKAERSDTVDDSPGTRSTADQATAVDALNAIGRLPEPPSARHAAPVAPASFLWRRYIEQQLSRQGEAAPAAVQSPVVAQSQAPALSNKPLFPAAKSSTATRGKTTGSPATQLPLREIARRKNLSLPLKNARVVVYKSQRRLELRDGNDLVKTYRIALGAQPAGHKQSQGDSRTPEGQFYICTRNASTSAFHIFLGLSYPALPDATRAANNKAITQREYQLIRQRLASRSAPPWETRLGGWVGIHGGTGDRFAQQKMRERGNKDWTAGCIALTNAEIKEIHAATKLGTPVLVKP